MSFAHSGRPQCGRPVAFGPPRWAAALLAGLGAVVAAAAYPLDGPGRLLGWVAAVGLLAGGGWVLGGPALRADDTGIEVRGLVRTHRVPWSDVDRVLVDRRRRSAAVEVEAADRLLVVPAVLLGRVRPAEAAAALERLRPPGAETGRDAPEP